MDTLEELLTLHGIAWSREVVDRGRVDILRRFRHYRAEMGDDKTALRLAYVDVSFGAMPMPTGGCPGAGSGCSGCPSVQGGGENV